MSGTYSAGSNIVIPGRASGAANTGNGTITNLVQSTTPSFVGLCTVKIGVIGSSTPFTATYVDEAGTVHTASGSVANTAGAFTNFSSTGFAVQFTITNGTGGSPVLFAQNDAFSLYLSEIGPSQMINAQQLTGASVTVQQFQTSSGPGLNWRAAIQHLFNYCGANPGILGVIPPGYYRCDDADTHGNVQLDVQSNMSIWAYGAIIGTSVSCSGNYGFLTVQTPSATITVSNVTIRGGTWGGTGINGVLSTNNLAEPYDGTRGGKVISLFVNSLTLIDVTVRGFAGDLAFALFGDNMILDNCSFWNSDEQMGAGGIRVLSGSNIRITNSQGRSGDDALQFAPIADSGSSIQSNGINNAFFIGGNVFSFSARAIVATIAVPNTVLNSVVSANITGVGFIGISAKVSSSSPLACQIANHNSTAAISNVSIIGCKFSLQSNTPTAANVITVDGGGLINGSASSYTGGVDDIRFSDVFVTNYQGTAVLVSGNYINPKPGTALTTTFTTNVQFTNCTFDIQLAGAVTYPPVVIVQQCAGFTFRGCVFTAFASKGAPALQLGIASDPHNVAFNGIVDGCRFFTNSPMPSGQSPAISISNADMISISGWSSFFLGTIPDYTQVSTPGTAISIASGVTNTYLDALDLRGMGNSTAVISDMGTSTIVGSNILSQSAYSPILSLPTAVNIPAYTKVSVNLTSTYTWPQGSTVLELSNTTLPGTGLVINLPTAQRDGEIRILSSTTETFPAANLALSGATVKGTTINIVTPSVALRMMWDMSGPYWFRI